MPRPTDGPVRPKNAAQAKARAKARKAKAPKVVRPPLRERLLVRLSSIDLDPRRFVTRVPFVVLVIGALGLGLGVTLWLSTDAAERSYELGRARQVNQALMQQKDGLERDVLEAQAAPALAEAARNLGMIPSRDTAHLVQDAVRQLDGRRHAQAGRGRAAAAAEQPAARAGATRAALPPPAPRVVDPREVAVHLPPRAVPLPNPEVARARNRRPRLRSRQDPDGPSHRSGAAAAARPRRPPGAAPLPAAPLGRLGAAPRLAAGARAARPAARRPTKRPGRPADRVPGAAGMSRSGTPHSANERRTRKPVADDGPRSASFAFRHRVGNGVILLVLLLAAGQLFMLQVPRAEGLRAEAASQLKVTDVEEAVRGSIVDRNDDKLAFTTEARALTFQPAKIQKQLVEAQAKTPDAPDPVKRLREIAKGVAGLLNNKPDADTLYKKLSARTPSSTSRGPSTPRSPTPSSAKYPEVGAERQDIRQYPGGSLAANIVGGIDWDGHGLLGLEDSLDAKLAGTDGSVTYDRGSDGVVIPGSYRNRHDAVNGSTVQLTLDDDIQFYVQQQVQQAKNLSGAKTVSAVVLDAKTGEVLAMSNDDTFDPSQDIGRQEDRQLGNLVGVLARSSRAR